MYPYDAGIRVGVEQGSQTAAVKAFEYPALRRAGVLDVLQHHAVQGVLRVMVLGEVLNCDRDAPPGAGVHRAKVEGPGAFTLGQPVAEQIVVGVADNPRRNSLENVTPVRVGPGPARVVGVGRTGWRRGVHDLPEPQRAGILVLGEQGVQQRCPRTWLTGGEQRRDDPFCGKGQAGTVGDEAQPAGQQSRDRVRGRLHAGVVEAGAVEPVDDQRHARGHGVVTEVGQSGLALRCGDHDVGVEGVHRVLPVSVSSASSTSRTLLGDAAA